MASVPGTTGIRQRDWVQCANRCGRYIAQPGICDECEARYALQGAVRKAHSIVLPPIGPDDPVYLQVYEQLQDLGLIARWDIVDAAYIAERVHRSPAAVKNSLNVLYSKHWLEKRRHGVQNEYRLAVYQA